MSLPDLFRCDTLEEMDFGFTLDMVKEIVERVQKMEKSTPPVISQPAAGRIFLTTAMPTEIIFTGQETVALDGVVLHRSRCSRKNLPTSIVFLELIGLLWDKVGVNFYVTAITTRIQTQYLFTYCTNLHYFAVM